MISSQVTSSKETTIIDLEPNHMEKGNTAKGKGSGGCFYFKIGNTEWCCCIIPIPLIC